MSLFFLHMPKTGGRAFQSWIDLMYPRSQSVELIHEKHWAYDEVSRLVYTTTDFDILAREQHIFLHGHCPAKLFLDNKTDRDILVTIIRDPVTRIASLYRFLRGVDTDVANTSRAKFMLTCAKNMSFDRFVEVDHVCMNEVQNMQAGLLLFGQFGDAELTDFDSFLACKEILKRFDVVGDYARLHDFCFSVAFAMKVITPKSLQKLNFSTVPPVTVSDLTRSVILERNSVDQALYDLAKKKFSGIIFQHDIGPY